MAGLAAYYFEIAAKNGILWELDAASLSHLLLSWSLKVKNEATVLEYVVTWASMRGRTNDIVSKVLPLVRFPLVPMTCLSQPVKRLRDELPIAADLIKGALKCQLSRPGEIYPPCKRRRFELFEDASTDYVTTSECFLPRQFCKNKVVHLDAVDVVYNHL